MANLDRVLKSRAFTLLTKVYTVTAIVFQSSCMDVKVGP